MNKKIILMLMAGILLLSFFSNTVVPAKSIYLKKSDDSKIRTTNVPTDMVVGKCTIWRRSITINTYYSPLLLSDEVYNIQMEWEIKENGDLKVDFWHFYLKIKNQYGFEKLSADKEIEDDCNPLASPQHESGIVELKNVKIDSLEDTDYVELYCYYNVNGGPNHDDSKRINIDLPPKKPELIKILDNEIEEGDTAVISVGGRSSKKDFPLKINIDYGDGNSEIKEAKDIFPNDPDLNSYVVNFNHIYNTKGEYTISAEAIDKSGLTSRPITGTIKVKEKESINLEKGNKQTNMLYKNLLDTPHPTFVKYLFNLLKQNIIFCRLLQ